MRQVIDCAARDVSHLRTIDCEACGKTVPTREGATRSYPRSGQSRQPLTITAVQLWSAAKHSNAMPNVRLNPRVSRFFEALMPAVAPIIAKIEGTRRAGQDREAPKRSGGKS